MIYGDKLGLPLLTACQLVSCRLRIDRKSTRLNSSHLGISYAVFCLKKKKKRIMTIIIILPELSLSIGFSHAISTPWSLTVYLAVSVPFEAAGIILSYVDPAKRFDVV